MKEFREGDNKYTQVMFTKTERYVDFTHWVQHFWWDDSHATRTTRQVHARR